MSPLPRHLCQVLEDEWTALGGSPGASGSWEFAEDHFRDPARLEAQLERRSDPVAALIKARRPPGASLAQALNALLAEPLYTPERFRHVRLGPDLTAAASLALTDPDDLKHLNRRLIESAFPGEIRPIYEIRLEALYRTIHGRAKPGPEAAPRAALCLSGGGIRSATFGLGVIQGLARLGLLAQFDYLSTVSGGGYIGSWLGAWIHRHPRGLPGVAGELAAAPPLDPLAPEPAAIRHLRQYTNYLSPKLGMMSADTWTLAATYLRNLLLNWLVLVPLLVAVAMVPRIPIAVLLTPAPDWVRILCLLAGMALLVQSVAYVGFYRPGVADFRRRRRIPDPGQRRFLWRCLAPMLLAGMMLVAYWTWLLPGSESSEAQWALAGLDALGLAVPARWLGFVITGVVVHLVAWSVYSIRLRYANPGEFAVVVGSGAVSGWLVWLATAHLLPIPTAGNLTVILLYVCFGVPVFLSMFLLGATVFVGLISLLTEDEDREWWARFGAWVLVSGLAWAVVSSLVLFAPEWLRGSALHVKALVASLGGLSGVFAALVGLSGKTPAKAAGPAPAGLAALLMRQALPLATVIALIALIVALSMAGDGLLALALKLEPSWMAAAGADLPSPVTEHRAILRATGLGLGLGLMALLAAVALGMAWFVNINAFSLHAMYRNRLVRAYFGASRSRRTANPFTGFDPDDDVQMHELRAEAFDEQSFADLPGFLRRLRQGATPAAAALAGLLPRTRRALAAYDGSLVTRALRACLLDELNELIEGPAVLASPALGGREGAAEPRGVAGVRESRRLLERSFPEIVPSSPRRPLHVVNLTLNLVGGDNLAWQERKAEPFTVTPWHAGSYNLGYRPSREYGGRRPGQQGISLGTAMAISGAAASPNMGYHSSPPLAFLMTLFNVRLGWWLGNPGLGGTRTFAKAFPMPSIRPIVAEAFALTDDRGPWVYLSDGGHFDNLGLLEMVLRRCHLIVVSDAGCDPGAALDDLGNAIRKVRSDLGVPISIDRRLRIYSRDNVEGRRDGTYAVLGTIDYRAVDGEQAEPGRLIYVKPAVYWRTEPVDVQNYAHASATFPHESTADQFFSESQFESYRALGFHEVRTARASTWPADWPTPPYSLARYLEEIGAVLDQERDGAAPR
jgi:hypothetical protein